MEGPNYHLVQRVVGRWAVWRPILGLVVGVLLMLVAQFALLLGFAVFYLATGADVGDKLNALSDTSHVTPSLLAYLNLSLAAAIPIVLFLTRVLHGMRPGWVSSVIGRLRWRWMAVTFGLALVALLATLVVGSFVPAAGDPADSTGGLNHWTDATRDFVVVIVLLTPLQAAGEEYAFRGYLTQAFGGLFRSRVAAVLIPAVLFALAHGAQDAPVFFDRLAFGIVSGILVIATGGLEAGIAMHVLNNFLAYGFALAFSDMTSALNPTGGSWWTLPTTLTQSLVYLALAMWAARRMGIARAVDRGSTGNVLEASEPRV
ncbi:MAG: protease family protein [Nocardioidaceae bacterium]|nr:protease family protein [Nocardioidaceae bacterium]